MLNCIVSIPGLIPFHSSRSTSSWPRYIVVATFSPHIIYKKGAVERMLERCTSTLDASGETIEVDKVQIRHAGEQMASRGLRVLAFPAGRQHVSR